MALEGKKRIFTMDRIVHQKLGMLSKQVDRTMSEIVSDGVELLNRLLFLHKLDCDLQYDHRFDSEIYDAVLEFYSGYIDEKEFKERLKEIAKKAKENRND
jgi:hypothetical protein